MIFRRLREAGVLGMNARNAGVISRWNKRKYYPNVDDKVRTKQLAIAAGIRVPRLIAHIEAYGDIRRIGELVAREESFVIKPARGAMGNGVLVIKGRDGDRFVRSNDQRLQVKDLQYHLSGVLAGLYSLGGRVDSAIIEERLIVHPFFEAVSAGGVPDLRVVVFRGVPIMAMTRLPTKESKGRANLHHGALAVGVDLRTGITMDAWHHGRPVSVHPDTGAPLKGIAIPHWDELMLTSARSADAFQLGYIGVDLVLDARHGPVLLEANARPGLGIQIANTRGLVPRLEAVEKMNLEGISPEHRVEISRTLA